MKARPEARLAVEPGFRPDTDIAKGDYEEALSEQQREGTSGRGLGKEK